MTKPPQGTPRDETAIHDHQTDLKPTLRATLLVACGCDAVRFEAVRSVLVDDLPVTDAAMIAGVGQPLVSKWVARARETMAKMVATGLVSREELVA